MSTHCETELDIVFYRPAVWGKLLKGTYRGVLAGPLFPLKSGERPHCLGAASFRFAIVSGIPILHQSMVLLVSFFIFFLPWGGFAQIQCQQAAE